MTTTTLTASCPPRFGTARNPDRPTLGHAVDAVARRLGKPFMPWQRYVADVILEVDPETGRLAYTEWGLTVPRQQGKSVFVEAKAAHRATATGFFGPRQHLVYTAQTRLKAREKWEEDFVPDLESSRDFARRIKVHKGNGNEHIRFTNGSRFGLEAVTEKAGHGPTLDEAYLDEAFAHGDWRLEQAFGPAMITRLNKQLGWISTAGWLDGSPYLQEKIALGRKAVQEGRQRGVAYFEWSAPERADAGDPAVWRACMPALRRTITEDAIRAEYEKARDAGKLNEFRRAYLNQWVPRDIADEWSVISQKWWLATMERDPQRPELPAFAIDMAPRRQATAIGVAGSRPDGRDTIEVADHRPGSSWVTARAVELNERWHPCAWVVDPRAAAGSLIDDLEGAGLEIVKVGAQDVAHACGQFYDAWRDDELRHGPDAGLESALAGAAKRELSDAWAWDRRSKTVDISPLVAVTLALWGHRKFGGSADGYDATQSVHLDAVEVARLYGLGVYGPLDIERLWSAGILDDAGLTVLAARGVPVPAGLP